MQVKFSTKKPGRGVCGLAVGGDGARLDLPVDKQQDGWAHMQKQTSMGTGMMNISTFEYIYIYACMYTNVYSQQRSGSKLRTELYTTPSRLSLLNINGDNNETPSRMLQKQCQRNSRLSAVLLSI